MSAGPLVRRNLRHHARLLAGLAAGLAVFEWLIAVAAARIELGPGFLKFFTQILPPAARPLLERQIAYVTFSGAVAFGLQHPIPLVAAVAFVIAAATVPAGERESGFLDLVLARPVSRHAYLLATVSLVALGALLLPAALLAGAALGIASVDVASAVPWVRYLPAGLGLALLLLAIGGCALLVAAPARRRGVAVSRAAALTLALYAAEVLGDLWKPLAPLRRISPFHYYRPVSVVVDAGLPTGDYVVLAAVAVVACSAALVLFRRADL